MEVAEKTIAGSAENNSVRLFFSRKQDPTNFWHTFKHFDFGQYSSFAFSTFPEDQLSYTDDIPTISFGTLLEKDTDNIKAIVQISKDIDHGEINATDCEDTSFQQNSTNQDQVIINDKLVVII